jgi:hypothetical protein
VITSQLGDAERIVRCVSHILFGACSVVGEGGVNILEDVRHSSVLYVCKNCASDNQKTNN